MRETSFGIRSYIRGSIRHYWERVRMVLWTVGLCAAFFVLFNLTGWGLARFAASSSVSPARALLMVNGWILFVSVVVVCLLLVAVSASTLQLTAERTREVGILRAVGLTRWNILTLFLSEVMLLYLGAAALGAGVGLLASVALSMVFPLDILSSATALFLRLAALILVTAAGSVFAALYPLAHAAGSAPVAALRYE